MKFTESIFKAYDIRGKVPDELTPAVARAVGKALADFLPPGEVVVGRDMRLDSLELAEALIGGLTRQGRIVVDLGKITSDMIYFAVGKYEYAGGAMITASHNPEGYNGIKLTAKGVVPIGDKSGLEKIKKAIIKDAFTKPGQTGEIHRRDLLPEWVAHALTFAPRIKPYKVAIDAGNGMAGIVVGELALRSPLHIDCMYCRLDGSFPNHPANPIVRANLAKEIREVRKKQLDFGIAFDGDGDRAVFIDNQDRPVPIGEIGALLCEYFLTQNPGATIIYDVRSSKIVPDTIEHNGGKAVRSPAGHTNIKALMRKHKAVFGAEQSGHYYFKDNYYADSGLIAALLTINILSESKKKTLSELLEPFNKYANSGEINFEVKNKEAVIGRLAKKFSDGKQDKLDGLTVNYLDWWFNVRPSNTEPLLRLNVESTSKKLTTEMVKKIEAIIKA